jgi:hypothetical protein
VSIMYTIPCFFFFFLIPQWLYHMSLQDCKRCSILTFFSCLQPISGIIQFFFHFYCGTHTFDVMSYFFFVNVIHNIQD